MVKTYKKTGKLGQDKGTFRRDIGRLPNGKQARFWLGRDRAAANLRNARLEVLWAVVSTDSPIWEPWPLEVAKAVSRGETTTTVPNHPALVADPLYYSAVVKQWASRFAGIIAIVPGDAEIFAIGSTAAEQKAADYLNRAIEMSADLSARLTDSTNEFASVLGTGQRIEDISAVDGATFHDAIDAYQTQFERDLPKLPCGNIRPAERQRKRKVANLKEHHGNFPLNQLTKDKIAEIIAYWNNRPSTKRGEKSSASNAKHVRDEFDRFLRWLDDSENYKWTMPKGVKSISRKIDRLASERRVSALTKQTFTPEQFGWLYATATDWEKLALLVGLNTGSGAAELGRLTLEDFHLYTKHPHDKHLQFISTDKDSFLRCLRPKTFVFGEWILWPETVTIVEWGIARAKKIGSDLLFCRQTGTPLYDESTANAQAGFTNMWTKCWNRAKVIHDDLPWLPFGSLRDTMPDFIRNHTGNSELASMAIAHGSPCKADCLIDCYANRPYGRLHEVLAGPARQYFGPMFSKPKPR